MKMNQPPKDFYDPEYLKNARKSKWYDVVTRNLTKCPFCDLKEKYIIKEVGGMVLTVNLFPYIDGHLMVVPKRHTESFDDLNKAEWEACHYLINLGMKIIRKQYNIDNINVLYREGKSAGASLKHFHIHILPITDAFMKYENQKFTWTFQDIELAPLEEAEMLRKTCQEIMR